MTKHVRKYVKKAVKSYCKNMYEFYKPCYDAGVNPIF